MGNKKKNHSNQNLFNNLVSTLCLSIAILINVSNITYAKTTPSHYITFKEKQPENTPLNTPPAHAIASAHPLATQAGIDILDQGGNAFDAAITVASVLAVVEPYSAGMGGGGFWLLGIQDQQEKPEATRFIMIDGRETAPSAATQDLFLNEDGSVNRDLAINTALSAGIPGQVAALAHLEKKYGTMPLARLLLPAIHYAENGFPVDKKYRQLLSYRIETLRKFKESSKIFLANNEMPALGTLVIQKDLAETLKEIAKHGRQGFYQGEIAKRLVDGVNREKGIWTLKDLASYQVVERTPIKSHFFGHNIISASPPSSGGIALSQILGQLNEFGDFHSKPMIDRIHLTVESMRRAYYDRSQYLGDPDFTPVPISKLVSNHHIENFAASISLSHATPSSSLSKAPLPAPKGNHTTHYSILDKWGNMVSATLSINLSFGSGFTVPGTGILLNNEMDDFDAAPNTPNSYGLIGRHANAIEAGKRPLSSMTPTIIQSNDKLAILGTPGGSRIITMVALSTLSMMNNKPIEEWVSFPRFHHQFYPDLIQHEPDTFNKKTITELEKRGHKLKSVGRQYGNMQAILWHKVKNEVTAASDPRGIGKAMVKDTNTQ